MNMLGTVSLLAAVSHLSRGKRFRVQCAEAIRVYPHNLHNRINIQKIIQSHFSYKVACKM